MTFVDVEPATTAEIVVFSIMAACYLAVACRTAYLGHQQSYYRASIVIHYLFPLSSVILCIENVSLAMKGTVIRNGESPYLYVLFALQATVVPILLNMTYEITYLVHKRRSVNFCGLFFDEGKRVKIVTTPVRSFVLRNFIRILGIALLAVGVVANFDLLADRELDEMAGMSGWYDLHPWTGQVHLLMSLLPTMVLILASFYESLVLWRYGTEFSMVVHSSILNPWFSLFFGTLALAGGQCFGRNLFPITSNLGYLIFICSIILLMKEVDKDMAAAEDFTEFLGDVAKVGNAISVRHAKLPASVAAAAASRKRRSSGAAAAAASRAGNGSEGQLRDSAGTAGSAASTIGSAVGGEAATAEAQVPSPSPSTPTPSERLVGRPPANGSFVTARTSDLTEEEGRRPTSSFRTAETSDVAEEEEGQDP